MEKSRIQSKRAKWKHPKPHGEDGSKVKQPTNDHPSVPEFGPIQKGSETP
tara:strand:- start:297 stop:446 length:150 start_codon:yes stop_codon:yes gene_type:complete